MAIHYNIPKRLFTILLICIGLMNFTACDGSIFSSYKDVERLRLVETMGFDHINNEYTMSLSSKDVSDDKKPLIFSAQGKSLSTAQEMAQNLCEDSSLYFSHVKYVLLGEELCEKALTDVLDFLQRSTKIRLDTSLYLCRETSGKDMMTKTLDENLDISQALGTIEASQKESPSSYIYNCREIVSYLNEFGSSLITVICLEDTKDKIFPEKESSNVLMDGYGILTKEGLVDYIPKELSLGVSILCNRDNYSSVSLELDGKGFSTIIKETSCKLSPVFEGDTLKSIDCKITFETGLREKAEGLDFTNDKTRHEMENVQKEYVKNQVEKVFQHSKDNCADFLGLYSICHDEKPSLMRSVAKSFPQSLEELTFNVEVDSQIDISYKIERGE